MTVLEAVQDIFELLKEAEAGDVSSLTAEAGSHWTIARILKWINRISKEVVDESLCLWETSLESGVASQREYAMGSDWGQILAVRFNDKPLNVTAIRRLDHWEKNGGESPWRDKTAAEPTHWYPGEQSGYYGLWKMPSSNGSDDIEVMHTVIPTEFTTSSPPTNELLNGKAWLKPYHRVIIHGVLEICFASDRDLKMTAYYNTKYKESKQELKMKTKRILDPMVAFEYDRGAQAAEMTWAWVNI